MLEAQKVTQGYKLCQPHELSRVTVENVAGRQEASRAARGAWCESR